MQAEKSFIQAKTGAINIILAFLQFFTKIRLPLTNKKL